MEGINWNMVDLGSAVVDDMDMDFATLFDPEHEQAHMQTVGSGWPVTSNPEKVSTTGSSPPQHAYHTEVPPETAAMTSTTHLQPQAESSASNSSSHAYAQAVDCSPRRMNNALSSQAKSDQKRHVQPFCLAAPKRAEACLGTPDVINGGATAKLEDGKGSCAGDPVQRPGPGR